MKKYFQILKQKYLDDTVDLAKLSKSFLLWGCGVVLVYIGNIYLTRLLGLKQYGTYAVFMNWGALATTFVTFGWDGYLMQQLPKLPEGENGKKKIGGILKRSVLSFLVLGILLTGIGIAVYHIYGLSDDYSMLFLLLLLALPMTAVVFIKSFLKVYNIVLTVQWLEEIIKPLLLLAFFGYTYYSQVSLEYWEVIYVNIALFAALAFILFLIASSQLQNKLSVRDARTGNEGWLKRCFYFLCIMLGYTFFSKMELLFLGYYNLNEDAGKYQILLRMADLVILPDFLFNYYLPQKFSHLFADRKKEEAERLFRKAARAIFVLQVLCMVAVAAVGYFYLKSFKIESPAIYILLIILCSSQLFYSLFGSTNLVLMTSGNEKYSFLSLAVVLILEAITNILWIPGFGLKAAVYISWGSVLVYTLILFSFVKKRLSFARPIV